MILNGQIITDKENIVVYLFKITFCLVKKLYIILFRTFNPQKTDRT